MRSSSTAASIACLSSISPAPASLSGKRFGVGALGSVVTAPPAAAQAWSPPCSTIAFG